MSMQAAEPQEVLLKITEKQFPFAAVPDSIVGILTANSQPICGTICVSGVK